MSWQACSLERSAHSAKRTAVLIAEHLEDDRFLLQAYCQGTPFDVTFAADGQQALSACQSGAFEVAVIDLQLPLIHGLSVIQEIRRFEKERSAKRLSILALLTHRDESDLARAREAGCDGHLTKPLAKKHFLSTLEQLSGQDAAAPGATVLIQIPEGMEELARRYLHSRAKEIGVFQGLLAQADLDGIRRLAHNLKGTGTSYGFPDITRLGGAIERAAKASNQADASQDMEELFNYIECASRQLGLAVS